jgi:hypothetical protein
LFSVSVMITFPDRESGHPASFAFQQNFVPCRAHLERGLTEEQSVITQALKWLWEHEFKEGLLFNGIHATDPEPDHGQGESY